MGNPMGHMTFVGRTNELLFLQRKWQEAQAGEPQLVTILGETGLGKTRLVQELYQWLSAHQDAGYWPASINNSDSSLMPNPDLADIHTEHEIPFLWWGLRWQRPNVRNQVRGSACAFVDELPQLQPHFVSLLRREAAISAGVASATALLSAIANLYSLGALNIALAVKEVHGLYQERKKYLEHEPMLAIEAHQKLKDAAISRIVEFLSSLLTRKTPVVLILDDAQWMDAQSVELVHRLMHLAVKGSWPLMVVATHWEREWIEAQVAHTDATQTPDSLGHRLFSDPTLTRRHVATLSLAKMDSALVEQLLISALPGLTANQKEQVLLKVDGNPEYLHDLILFLSNKRSVFFENRDTSGALNSDGELQLQRALNSEHQGIMRMRFEQMEPRVQELLSFGSRSGPRFVDQLVIETATELAADADPRALTSTLGTARSPYVWTAEAARGVSEFRQRRYYELAAESLNNLPSLSKDFDRAFEAVLARWYEAGRHQSLSPVDKRLFLELLAALSSEDELASNAQRRRACLELVKNHQDSNAVGAAGELALRLLTSIQQDATRIDDDDILRWNTVGIALAEIGRASEAAYVYDAMIERSKDLNVMWSAYINRGALRLMKGDITSAVADWTVVIGHLQAIAEQVGIDIGNYLPSTLGNRAIAWQMQGETTKALADASQAIALLESLETRVPDTYLPATSALLADILGARADIMLDAGSDDYTQATEDTSRAINILESQARLHSASTTDTPSYDRLPDERLLLLARVYLTRGTVRRRADDITSMDDLERSIELVQARKGSAQSLKLREILANSHINRGVAAYRWATKAQAVEHFTRAIEILESLLDQPGSQRSKEWSRSLSVAIANRNALSK